MHPQRNLKRAAQKARRQQREAYSARLAERNATLTPKFQDVIYRYARMLPKCLTDPIDDASQTPAQRRINSLLILAGEQLQLGQGQEAMGILDDAVSLLRRDDEFDKENRRNYRHFVFHLQLKARAAQGLLPAHPDVERIPVDRPNLPAIQLGLMHFVYQLGHRRIALLACEHILMVARLVYLDGPSLDSQLGEAFIGGAGDVLSGDLEQGVLLALDLSVERVLEQGPHLAVDVGEEVLQRGAGAMAAGLQ